MRGAPRIIDRGIPKAVAECAVLTLERDSPARVVAQSALRMGGNVRVPEVKLAVGIVDIRRALVVAADRQLAVPIGIRHCDRNRREEERDN